MWAVFLLTQAAAAAGKHYLWAVDTDCDGALGTLFTQLLAVISGCVAPDPTRRLTVPEVLDTLTRLQGTVAADTATAAAAAAAGGGGSCGGSPVPGATASPFLRGKAPVASMYDVLAIIDAMEAVGIDANVVSAVADVIGVTLTSTLDPLAEKKVPVMRIADVRRLVTPTVTSPYHAIETMSVRTCRAHA